MRLVIMRLIIATLIFCCAAFSQQTTSQQTAPQPASLMTSEDAVAIFNQIGQRAARLEPMLEQIHPKDWTAKGAPDTYVAQWNSLLDQFRAVQSDMAALAQHPSGMTDSMRALFRLQATHLSLDSLLGGVRKYQNPALADLIESVAAENNADIDGFERYLLGLATEKEEQYAVVDHEAQRCRATLSRQPAAPASKNGRTTQ